MTLYYPIEIRVETEEAITQVGNITELDEEWHRLTQLWCEVIRLGVEDIYYHRHGAWSWLHGEDFIRVCQLAGIHDPLAFRRAIAKLPKCRRWSPDSPHSIPG